MQPRSSAESRSSLIRWIGIEDANTAGFVHGGVVLRLCDEAAGLAAARHAGRRVVTAGMDRVAFLHPVHVGEVLTCSASLNAVWRTSMEVGVRVTSENVRTREVKHTSSAYVTMVAIDDEGRPTAVPPLRTQNETEERRRREAELRRRNRLAEREQILRHREGPRG